ncbi:L-rhamnose isomerase/sugar isomerase [Aliiruegeria haliotis]|uniref:L-rhamnose isomerase/sugar isomerase n=1 Tax=Aliiruegeria haliotis TaxID=1280846 RepID=A0A2T0RIE0_9RHOB|nr:TIM barrel protein [Aliiruegeria haliotis]PRY20976.1 L-rhamnose isomerase/sugar isomerase [Aliiruegeria haliotis]
MSASAQKHVPPQAGGTLPTEVKDAFWARPIETAGWCFTATGSRFHIHASAGAARTPLEKIADAGLVHRLTGVTPEVAINTLVDLVDETPANLRAACDEAGIRIGSLCPNLSRDNRFRFGSLTNSDAGIRATARDLVTRCLEHADTLGATALSLWLPDGLHYPGQADIARRYEDLANELAQISGQVPDGLQFLLEYKLFEPAPYYTDIPDWGTALMLAETAGENCTVLVDFGHHAQGVNIPAILALLMRRKRLGALHINDRLNADDDLTVGAINPYMMFLSFCELAASGMHEDIRFGFDQHHTTKSPLMATVQSVCRVQELWLKALLVDRAALAEAQENHDTVASEEVLQSAFWTDVRPILEEWREERGLPRDPMAALAASGVLAENEIRRK